VFSEFVRAELDQGRQVYAAYLDFAKAFDKVDNDILLQKLSQFGFSPRLLKLFAGYLGDRRQIVSYGGHCSVEYFTRSGVNQGSTLGPTLFSIFINSLPSVLSHTSCLMFADDVKIYISVRNPEDLAYLQADLNAVVQFGQVVGLELNASKSVLMAYSRSAIIHDYHFKIGNRVLRVVSSVVDLGVTFDGRLNFHGHIQDCVSRSYRRLGFILRCSKELNNPRSLLILFNSLVLPILEYCSIIWSPHELTYVESLESVHKVFLRSLYAKTYHYYPFMFPSLFLMGALGQSSLSIRRELSLLKFIIQIIRGSISVPDALRLISLYVPPNYIRSRSHSLFALPKSRTNLLLVSPLNRSLRFINDWSSQRGDVFHMSFPSLMAGLMTHLYERH
jgi:Reverse transcriptase (RNA-dependent DNA polymerase)